MGPKTGLKSGSYTAAMSEQLKEDCITDELAWVVFCKGILSLSFSHQQTWLERRSTKVGRQSNQGPFSPDIYICSLPLMDLEALNQFECGLEGMHQSSDLWIHNERNEGFCQVSNSDGSVIFGVQIQNWQGLASPTRASGRRFLWCPWLSSTGWQTTLERHQAFRCQLISAGDLLLSPGKLKPIHSKCTVLLKGSF